MGRTGTHLSGCTSSLWLAETPTGGLLQHSPAPGAAACSEREEGKSQGERGARRLEQGLDSLNHLSRPSVSLNNFSRGMQEREDISILHSTDAWGLQEACCGWEASRVSSCGSARSSYPRVSWGKGKLMAALCLEAGWSLVCREDPAFVYLLSLCLFEPLRRPLICTGWPRN